MEETAVEIVTDLHLREPMDKAAAILRANGAREVYVFGSVENGAFCDDASDMDLAVASVELEPRKFISRVEQDNSLSNDRESM